MASGHGVFLALLCGTACVAEVGGDDTADETRTLGDGARVVEVKMISPGREPDVCELLPHCGPCSVACDYDKLREFVPSGTCAAFYCELTDGSHASFHACHI